MSELVRKAKEAAIVKDALGRFLPLACGTNDNQLSTISSACELKSTFFRRQNTFIVLRSASLLHCSNTIKSDSQK